MNALKILSRTIHSEKFSMCGYSLAGMVKIALQIKASMENCTRLRPLNAMEHRWFVKFKCSSCGETAKHWQHISANEKHEVKGGRGQASAVIKCKLCGRENSCDLLDDAFKEYHIEKNGEFSAVAAFDCR